MKKIIKYCAIALVLIVALCSFRYANKEGSEIQTDGEQMRVLYYHGHSYIGYRFYAKGRIWPFEGGYGYGGASIVHDPDCKCGKGGDR